MTLAALYAGAGVLFALVWRRGVGQPLRVWQWIGVGLFWWVFVIVAIGDLVAARAIRRRAARRSAGRR